MNNFLCKPAFRFVCATAKSTASVSLGCAMLLLGACSDNREGNFLVPALAPPTSVGVSAPCIEGPAILCGSSTSTGASALRVAIKGDAEQGTSDRVEFFVFAERYAALVMVNTGGLVTECTVTPALPEGLSVRKFPQTDGKYANSCVLEGTATTGVAAAKYTVSASNDTGEATAKAEVSLEIIGAGAFFSEVHGDFVTARGLKAFDFPMGVPVEIYITNAGKAGTAQDSCKLTFSGMDSAFSGLTVEVASDEQSCIIKGSVDTVIPASAGIEATITTTVSGSPSNATFPVTVTADPTCDSLELPDATSGAFPVQTAGTADSLFVRGNHAEWNPLPEYQFAHKAGDMLQNVATIVARFNNDGDPTYAAADSISTQFKLASNDGSWTTQLWVPQEGSTDIRTADEGGKLELGETYTIRRGNAGVDNNHISLLIGASYMITLAITNTGAEDGEEKGTMKFDRCAASTQ